MFLEFLITIWIILISTVTEFFSISAFVSLVGISIGTMSSPVKLKTFVRPARIKKYNSIIKKKKKHDKIVLLAKSILNSMQVLFSKALIDSNISNGETF